jgi:hypothetical protein
MRKYPRNSRRKDSHNLPEANAALPQAADAISRRAFVKQSSSLLLVGGAACGDGTNPGATGTLRLLLTGLHPSATTGGTAVATPTAGGNSITITIPPAGDQSAAVPVGSYTVSYTPPAGHSLAPGGSVASTVTITEGQTTTISIELISVGSIQVTVNGLTGSPANGGSASAQRTDAAGSAIPISISAAGSGAANNVPTGTYSVTYTPPGGFNVSGTNPVTGIAVSPGVPGSATFTVTANAQVGSIRVTATGLTGATSGGSASAKLTDNSGSTFNVSLGAPSGGTSTGDLTGLPVGSYNVTYTPPSGFRLVNSAQSPAVVAVTSGAQSTTSFANEVQPAAAGVVFRSDWSTAVGTSNSAVQDQGKTKPWNIRGGAGLEVIPATGLDFPTTNVLRVTAESSSAGFGSVQVQALGVPAIGSSIWYRVYVRMAFPDALPDNETHPLQDGATGGRNWELDVEMNPGTAGKWQPRWRLDALDNGNNNDWIPNGVGGTPTMLDKNVTYRMELQIKRTSTTGFEMHTRIYNSAGVQILGDANFRNFFNTATLASVPAPALVLHNPPGLDALTCGCNGISGASPPFPFVYCYWGAVAVSNQDWLGPYAGGI